MKTLKDAVIFAANVCDTALLCRCMEAASVAGGLTQNEEIISAALLCAAYQKKVISAEGAGDLVLSCADPENAETAEGWRMEKQRVLDFLPSASSDQKMVVLANCLADLRKIHRDYLLSGDAIWGNFVQKDKFMFAWYYRNAAELLASLQTTAAHREFLYLIDEVFESQFDL